MASSPSFTGTVVLGMAQISTANTNRDGTGTIADVVIGAANGTRIDNLYAIATGTTAAGMLRFYLYDGANTRLWLEIPTAAITPSGTVQAAVYSVANMGLLLPVGYKLRASTNNAETWNITAMGGSF